MPQRDANVRIGPLVGLRRREEAPSRAIWTLAAPVRTIRARLRFVERDRFASKQQISPRGDVHLLGRDGETIAFTAAPLAGRVAKRTAGDPAVMSERE